MYVHVLPSPHAHMTPAPARPLPAAENDVAADRVGMNMADTVVFSSAQPLWDLPSPIPALQHVANSIHDPILRQ
jgi:hypothetical protein